MDDLDWLLERFIWLCRAYGNEVNTRREHDEEDEKEIERARDIIENVKDRLA